MNKLNLIIHLYNDLAYAQGKLSGLGRKSEYLSKRLSIYDQEIKEVLRHTREVLPNPLIFPDGNNDNVEKCSELRERESSHD